MSRKWIMITAVLVLVVVAVGATLVLAQEPGPAPVAMDETLLAVEAEGNGRLFTREAYDAALAEELGISVSALTAARDTARSRLIDQALADGQITAAQAETMRNGERPHILADVIDRDVITTAIAQALGITVEEMQAARAAGQQLPELAESLGVEMREVRAAVRAAFETAVQQAVADGSITQAQGDWLLRREWRPGTIGRGINR